MKGKIIRAISEEYLQKGMNEFLNNNEDIVITNIVQSTGSSYTTITIIYYNKY